MDDVILKPEVKPGCAVAVPAVLFSQHTAPDGIERAEVRALSEELQAAGYPPMVLEPSEAEPSRSVAFFARPEPEGGS